MKGQTACCVACHGVFATPNPFGANIGLLMNLARQLALGDVAQREPKPMALDVHDDQPDTCPGVEPSVQERQLGCALRELEEAESGAEGGEAAVGHGSAPG
jgi:hypothetical protein